MKDLPREIKLVLAYQKANETGDRRGAEAKFTELMSIYETLISRYAFMLSQQEGYSYGEGTHDMVQCLFEACHKFDVNSPQNLATFKFGSLIINEYKNLKRTYRRAAKPKMGKKTVVVVSADFNFDGDGSENADDALHAAAVSAAAVEDNHDYLAVDCHFDEFTEMLSHSQTKAATWERWLTNTHINHNVAARDVGERWLQRYRRLQDDYLTFMTEKRYGDAGKGYYPLEAV